MNFLRKLTLLKFLYSFVVFTYFVEIVVCFATTGCSSSLAEDSLSELPAAKNLDSAIFCKEQDGGPRVSGIKAHTTSDQQKIQ